MPEEKGGELGGDFLAGGGEMGERIRNFDWSSTPLGAVADRPQSMRLSVSLCVKSSFPIIIHWGWPTLTVLYNNAFLPFAGEKHPKLLGRPLFESWPELRPTLGPMLESVLTTQVEHIFKAFVFSVAVEGAASRVTSTILAQK